MSRAQLIFSCFQTTKEEGAPSKRLVFCELFQRIVKFYCLLTCHWSCFLKNVTSSWNRDINRLVQHAYLCLINQSSLISCIECRLLPVAIIAYYSLIDKTTFEIRLKCRSPTLRIHTCSSPSRPLEAERVRTPDRPTQTRKKNHRKRTVLQTAVEKRGKSR